ncbi:hypothetical protein SEA_BLUEFEATHER_18 [Arthrobacter phage BlueFeather]|uniref:Uncharacterized protein n=1 Tax=Arthrobacter phage BlueFeather TaxID=2713258 RepID=A0A6G8R2A5_9CAUD|nr:hypothetical protein QEX68_gp18 [Arthrobacter phage BlueFeather]QIN94322.1 hypothetical protein SEA_BLUEFEATHER_18 [Arthrobacter phage BlueFeather]
MNTHHDGDHVDVDPYIPTGQCALCLGVPQDTTLPEEREGAAPAEFIDTVGTL